MIFVAKRGTIHVLDFLQYQVTFPVGVLAYFPALFIFCTFYH